MNRTRSRVVAAVAVAASLAAGAVTALPAGAHPGLPSSVFDPTAVGWASLRDYSVSSLETQLAAQRSAGKIALDVDADPSGSSSITAAVLQTNVDGRDWRVRPRMTSTQYSSERTAATQAGLRQVDFEAYTEGSTQMYAAAWVEDRESLDTRHEFNLTSDQAQALYEQLRGTHMPVDIDVYQTSAGVRYASIWVRNTEGLGWVLRRNVTSQQFNDQTTALGFDYRLLGFDSLLNGTSQIYSGIWVENRNGRLAFFQRDLTAQQYQNYWYRHRDEGYRLVGYERYTTTAGVRYAGLWRQNSDRPTWSLRASVDSRVTQEINDFDVPGMSVAVMQNGQVRYLRGFGYADVNDGVWLDSTHVLRLASVSKAVAGVLTIQAENQGRISVDDRTRTHLTGLPSHHTHTIEQLVSNRGCVGHYEDMPDSINDRLASTRYTTARAAAQEFWSQPLASGCAVGDSHYSTHGYTILGAALEQATGDTVNELVVNNITNPEGLSTLRPEDRFVSARRVTLYNTDNTEATPDQISWKVLGGGLESSVEHLAGFGDLLIRDQIVSQADQDQMWESTGWSYAYGWSIGTQGGRLRVGKDGSQLGANSYLLMYPDDGITVAVLSNRQGGGHDAETVAKAIGAMVADSLS